MIRLHHKGRLAIYAGLLILAVTITAMWWFTTVIALWVISMITVGLLLILWGFNWEARIIFLPVSERALTHMHWLSRHCPQAAELLQLSSHPTWAEAFYVEEQCRKRMAQAGKKERGKS
jgi:hypothetical protein